MNARHKDGTHCDGGGWNQDEFENRNTCPLCCQNSAAVAVDEACGQLRLIAANHNCEDAFQISETLKGFLRRIERLTWEKKGGAR